jgi:hypothetical protein
MHVLLYLCKFGGALFVPESDMGRWVGGGYIIQLTLR